MPLELPEARLVTLSSFLWDAGAGQEAVKEQAPGFGALGPRSPDYRSRT